MHDFSPWHFVVTSVYVPCALDVEPKDRSKDQSIKWACFLARTLSLRAYYRKDQSSELPCPHWLPLCPGVHMIQACIRFHPKDRSASSHVPLLYYQPEERLNDGSITWACILARSLSLRARTIQKIIQASSNTPSLSKRGCCHEESNYNEEAIATVYVGFCLWRFGGSCAS